MSLNNFVVENIYREIIYSWVYELLTVTNSMKSFILTAFVIKIIEICMHVSVARIVYRSIGIDYAFISNRDIHVELNTRWVLYVFRIIC